MPTEDIRARDVARRINERRQAQAESLPFADRRTGQDRRSGHDRRACGARDGQD